jgi:hypothetical protein
MVALLKVEVLMSVGVHDRGSALDSPSPLPFSETNGIHRSQSVAGDRQEKGTSIRKKNLR